MEDKLGLVSACDCISIHSIILVCW